MSPFSDKESCHPDTCALFLGGSNLEDLKSSALEDLIKKNDEIPQNFVHVVKKKKDDYGFIHFNNVQEKDNFFYSVRGAKFKIEEEKNITVKFQPIKRKSNESLHSEYRNKPGSTWQPYYNLYDDSSHFIIVLCLPSITNKDEIKLFTEGEENIIISGEYKELDFAGSILKKSIPVGDFEYVITLPSKIELTSKVKIEKIENSNMFKFVIKKSQENKRIKLDVE
ncbi:Hsp20/alpha crystallin family protein [Rhizophagus irregularis DAOM 181602=DAOM 197198]|nr:Hsp20/alpha crystallin family protein [Rhizophagus irregularis DAOM 181602=DAOM 197198]